MERITRRFLFNNLIEGETLDNQIDKLLELVKDLEGELEDYKIVFYNNDVPIKERSGVLLALISHPKMAKRQSMK